MFIRTKLLREIDIARFRRMRDVVDFDPPYQRESGVWKDDARSLLIDSIINSLDVPKLYFEVLDTRRLGPSGWAFQYAVIDGKQRLDAILAFLDDQIVLPEDFIFFEDENVQAQCMKFSQIREKYPLLAQKFLEFELPIVEVTSDSGDLIEEMFQRLNASKALNAAERRNAISGATRDAANQLAEHELLVSRSPIRSARYKYREFTAKFLAIEDQMAHHGRIIDTKAQTLLDLFNATHGPDPKITDEEMSSLQERVTGVLDVMARIFEPADRLLASAGTMVVYYLAFRNPQFADSVERSRLMIFEETRRTVAKMLETAPEYSAARYSRLREYNSLVQSTNDGRALHRRSEILEAFILGYSANDPLQGLDNTAEGELPTTDESEDA